MPRYTSGLIDLLSVVFGAAFTVAVAIAGGRVLLRALGLRFHREEQWFFAFVAGSACLSLMVFALAMIGAARAWVFLVLGAALIAAACRWGRESGGPLPNLGVTARVAFYVLFAAFGVFYLCTALAPEISPDGSGYHLGLVSRYARAHGFYRITTDIYAYLSAGVEMLFLHAFVFGRHSAAALTHFAFYVALPLGMLLYGRRFGFPGAAATGALLVFMAPIVGFAGSAAYNDVALACVLFALFYLLQIWDRERNPALFVPIGLLAGFAYAVKYTGFLAAPYAAAFITWKLLRKRHNPVSAVAIVGACALLSIAPWALKNWIWVGNPLAPFYNQWFPNPYVHIGFETEYRAFMANWGELPSKWQIPLEVTVRGERLQGLLGPAFLLLPLGLIALRRPAGRQLLLAAAVFTATYPANLGTRFLIPMLPFASLALGLVVADWKWAAPALVAFHTLSAWPVNVKRYCHPDAMRIQKFPRKAALRQESEDGYLRRASPGYHVAQMIEHNVPQDARVLCFSGPPHAYTSRETLVSYQGALNQNLTDMLRFVEESAWQPKQRHVFHFGEQNLSRIRVVQAGRAITPDGYWGIHEARVYFRGVEVRREPQWRLSSKPNRWEIPLAFDNNPMTQWRTWQPFAPGMYVEIDFGGTQRVDALTLDGPPEELSKLWLEGWLDDGRQIVLSGGSVVKEIAPPANMRGWVAAEIKWNGIEYLLLNDFDGVGRDIREHAAEYGMREIAATHGAHLYKID